MKTHIATIFVIAVSEINNSYFPQILLIILPAFLQNTNPIIPMKNY